MRCVDTVMKGKYRKKVMVPDMKGGRYRTKAPDSSDQITVGPPPDDQRADESHTQQQHEEDREEEAR